MAARKETWHFQVKVRGDLDSVVSWWTSPERRAEQRSNYESFDVSDFRYSETLDDGQRTTEWGWTTRRGLQVSVRSVAMARPDGTVERAPDGRVIVRSQVFRTRRWPNGRDERTRYEFVLEFRELPGSRTSVRETATAYTEGVPWWDIVAPASVERRHRRMHLKDAVARCEHDLGTRKSAKRWFAVY